MGMTVNKPAFDKLIDEDIEWLLQQERTLERDHIQRCLEFLKGVGPSKIDELELENIRKERVKGKYLWSHDEENDWEYQGKSYCTFFIVNKAYYEEYGHLDDCERGQHFLKYMPQPLKWANCAEAQFEYEGTPEEAIAELQELGFEEL